MREKRLARGLYGAGLVPLIFVSLVSEPIAYAMFERLPSYVQRSEWKGYVLNILAPLLGGIGCAVILIILLTRWHAFTATWRAHIGRAFSWYTLAAAIVWIIAANLSNRDFPLWSQLIIWPLVAIVGALATDALWTSWRGRRAI